MRILPHATTNSRRWTQYAHLAGNKQKRHSEDKTWNITDDETSRTKHKTREWQNKTGRSKHRDANLTQTQRPDRLHTLDIRVDTER